MGVLNSAPAIPLPYTDSVGSLDRAALHAAYRSGTLTPDAVIRAVFDRISARGRDSVWISLVDKDTAIDAALDLRGGPDDPATPLWGLPFAVKDNIDVAGLPTTAGCPDFAYVPAETATACEMLVAAGAIFIGKTNLDQFATGLNGTRSPYGAPRTPFDESRISGGSSSGSAVAVSAGLVTFSLGTDTAGSGRVPAALTNVVGVKPSIGLVSSRGMLPACHSLDCISVFALTVADGARVTHVVSGQDSRDAWSRDLPVPAASGRQRPLDGLVLAVPHASDIDFDSAPENADAWTTIIEALTSAGARLRAIPFAAFFDAGARLYSGGWLAERLSSVEGFLDESPDSVFPVTRQILENGRSISGSTVFRDLDEVRLIKADLAPMWDGVDALLTPTVTRTFTVDEMLADPIANNAALGRFTTFTNILDLAAVAVPVGFTSAGLPFGITVSARAGSDEALASIAASVESLVEVTLGATGYARTPVVDPVRTAEFPVVTSVSATPPSTIQVAVVGAHLSGMPLNSQLSSLDATLVATTATSPDYRLFALPNTSPPKPGLKRVTDGGVPIEVEVYALSPEGFGRFVDLVPAPLAIGTLELEDGSSVHGFVCEPWALDAATDISHFGGWRAYAGRVE